jgi:hypothetical protein
MLGRRVPRFVHGRLEFVKLDYMRSEQAEQRVPPLSLLRANAKGTSKSTRYMRHHLVGASSCSWFWGPFVRPEGERMLFQNYQVRWDR